MPINVNTILAGFKAPVPIAKAGIATAAVGSLRGYNLRYANGNPGTYAAPSSGINGAAVTGNAGLTRTDPSGAVKAYAAGLNIAASTAGTMWLIDRLWHNSGLVVTQTTAQTITPAALPARDLDGATAGRGVMAAMEWSATGGAGTPTVTLTYTNSASVASRTAVMTGVATPPVGTFEIFASTSSGDLGIQSVQSFIQSATRTSGTMHLVLFKPLLVVQCVAAGIPGIVDSLTGGRPELFNGSSLEMVWFPSVTTATGFFGSYTETQLDPT